MRKAEALQRIWMIERDYRRKKNPGLALLATGLALRAGVSVPPWCRAYLIVTAQRMAELAQGKPPAEVDKAVAWALDFTRPGAGSPFRALKQADRDRKLRLATDFGGRKNPKKIKKTVILAEVAQAHGISMDTVKRARKKSKISRDFAHETSCSLLVYALNSPSLPLAIRSDTLLKKLKNSTSIPKLWPEPKPGDRILRRPKMAEMAGVSVATLKRWSRLGVIPPMVQIGPRLSGQWESVWREWLTSGRGLAPGVRKSA